MSSRLEKLTRTVAVGGAGVVALAALTSAAGMRANSSPSIPVGFYWTSANPISKGAYVIFCPPSTQVFVQARAAGYLQGGLCPGGFGYLMKKVVAGAGDAISISARGVSVNGETLPLSAPFISDKAGRHLPRFSQTEFLVGELELLLMSDVSSTSFDGRYFGPIDRTQVRSVIVPVLTW